MALADAVLNQTDVSPTERELETLAVTAVNDVPFMLYAHIQIDLGIGMTDDHILMASKGAEPKALTDEEKVVYATALELTERKTPVSEEKRRRAEKKFRKVRCARLAHVVGLFLYKGNLLRMAAIPAP